MKKIARKILSHKQYGEFVTPIIVAITGATVLSIGIFFIAPAIGKGTLKYTQPLPAAVVEAQDIMPKITHVQMPKNVRGIYMSQCAASSDTFRRELMGLIKSTEINSIVIDVKDFTGTVAFTRPSLLKSSIVGSGCRVKDMQVFINKLHKDGVYVIARITVFQDPLYTKIHPEQAVQSRKTGTPWKDYKGLSFVDVGARPFWDYIVEISREAQNIGFDELNYDYIRFPSDGPMSDVVFNYSDYTQRPLELEKFFRYVTHKVRRPDATGYIPKLSADLFGMTTTSNNDLIIGQVMERATPYFDIIAPMTYPSHYPRGFNGYANPNENVYGVVKYSLEGAIKRITSATTTIMSLTYQRIGTTTPARYKKPKRTSNILRPWIQDFNYGGVYDAKKVRAQIQATYDAGVSSWVLWAPSNHYTKEALNPSL